MRTKFWWSQADDRLLGAVLGLAALLVGVFGVLAPALGVVGLIDPVDTREVETGSTASVSAP
ncbi:hypothetical protein ACR6C2_20465 [Streptomyces sp. INA 01156]